MKELIQRINNTYDERYGAVPEITGIAPGRVNIIGEHTDYTGGFVLPAAIDREIVVAVGKDNEETITAYSVDYEQGATIDIGEYDPEHPCVWLRYIMGVLDELEKAGHTITGFNLVVGGDVPIGSGLSSSAALETATLSAMEGLMGFELADKNAALLCQRAENNFVGMNCGIMDQYISRVGREGHAILIDCTDLSIEPVAMKTPGHTWLVIDSQKKRGLVDSEYNLRRKQCEQGVLEANGIIENRKITGMRDITIDDLDVLEDGLDDEVFRRVRHVVTENNRVLEASEAFRGGAVETIGSLLTQSHESLRDDFEVSCEELDMLVNIVADTGRSPGARLTGAGFGGCIIALVEDGAVEEVRNAITEQYKPESLPANTRAEIWNIEPSDGARRM